MKIVTDLLVMERTMLTPQHALLFLRGEALPPILPGQFVEVRVDGSPNTFLRRPISIHYYNGKDTLQLLVHDVGEGTHRLCHIETGKKLNCVLPLGNGFTQDLPDGATVLLIGGGVGVAPLLFLGSELKEKGYHVTFLLGGKTETDILQREAFEHIGRVGFTTEDGSLGVRGFVTDHPWMKSLSERVCLNESDPRYIEKADFVYTCGPKPMMQAVARLAHKNGVSCEVSLENMMACGIGACLCCVEKTISGHQCVCTQGPVFNTRDLLWTAAE